MTAFYLVMAVLIAFTLIVGIMLLESLKPVHRMVAVGVILFVVSALIVAAGVVFSAP